MTRQASLPIYHLPETVPARSAFWNAIRTELGREGLGHVPEHLDFKRPPVPDRIGPDVFFSQVCGYPLQTIYRGQATILAAPVYEHELCDGPTHAAVFIVHQASSFHTLRDLRGCRFFYNSRHSNSGMNLPRRAIADIAAGQPFFGSVIETHGQMGNLVAVAERKADATCVDNVSWAFFAAHRPAVARSLRVLAATAASPSIPFITSSQTDPATADALRRALLRVGSDPAWEDIRRNMLLRAIVAVAARSYADVLRYEREAAALGYPELV